MDTLIIYLTQYLMKRADDNARFNSTLKDLKDEMNVIDSFYSVVGKWAG